MFRKISLLKVLLCLFLARTVGSDFNACGQLSPLEMAKIVFPIAFKKGGSLFFCALVPFIVKDKANRVLGITPLKSFWRMAIAGVIAAGAELACRGLVLKSGVSRATIGQTFGLHVGVPCVSYVGAFCLSLGQVRRQLGISLPQSMPEIMEILRELGRHLRVVVEPRINQAPVLVPQGQQVPLLAQLQSDHLVFVLIAIVPATNLKEVLSECCICKSEQKEENPVRSYNCRLSGEPTDGHAICARCAAESIVTVDDPISIIRNALPMCSICRANVLPTVATAVLALLAGATPDHAIAVAQDQDTVDCMMAIRVDDVKTMINFIRDRLGQVRSKSNDSYSAIDQGIEF